MKLRALIADDEPLARERLGFLLAQGAEVQVAGECRNGREVVAALKEERFDVLFLDIRMPGMDGFEVIREVGPAHMPATVFVTAFDDYAVRAFEVHALDYLTKPVEPERLVATISRVKEKIASQTALLTQQQMKVALAGMGLPKRLLVPNGTKDSFVAVDEIDWIEAADYYACLHVGPKSFMLRETIKQLATMLDPRRFVRIHRSVIVNVERVSEVLREGSVVLKTGQRLKMSKEGWQNLRNCLG
jgi:two-component system, LytTR family, response regulator